MHSSATPCGRLSLPLIRAGRVSSSITANMTGISITSEAFMPAMVEFCGMLKGASVTGFDKDTYDYNMTCEGEVTADDINVVATGRQAVVGKKVEKTAEGYKATISVTAADYRETHVYTVNIKTAAPAGINAAVNNTNAAPAAIYNAAGQRVNAAAKGLNIVKSTDGTVKKVMVK